MRFDARVTIHGREHSSPDYRQVHSRLESHGWLRTVFSYGETYRTLPGMYTKFNHLESLVGLTQEIRHALNPLGFDISIQLMRVTEECDFRLKPEPHLSTIGDALRRTALPKGRSLVSALHSAAKR